MKFKKALSCVVAAAMIISVVVAMSATVGASGFRTPTYDSKNFGWFVNDFRYGTYDNDEITNKVEIIEFYTEFSPNEEINMTVRMPEGVDYADVRFVRVELEVPATLDTDNMNNIAVIFQNTMNSWQHHSVHPNAAEMEACRDQAARVCSNGCKFELVGGKFVADIPIDLTQRLNAQGVPTPLDNDYLIVIVTADWGDGDVTPGRAKMSLLTAGKEVIKLTRHCVSPCNGDCKCPCNICNKFPCDCPAGLPSTTAPNNTTTPPATTTTTAANTTATTANSATASASQTTNPPTGIVTAIIPTLLAAAAAVAVSRKRK